MANVSPRDLYSRSRSSLCGVTNADSGSRTVLTRVPVYLIRSAIHRASARWKLRCVGEQNRFPVYQSSTPLPGFLPVGAMRLVRIGFGNGYGMINGEPLGRADVSDVESAALSDPGPSGHVTRDGASA